MSLQKLLLATALVTACASEASAQKEFAPAPDLPALRTLEKDLIKMAGRGTAATISLTSRGGRGAGSGVVVSEDGLILTAGHVLAALGDEVIVTFPDGSRKPAVRLGADFDRDAAMVQITEEGSYAHVELGESAGLRRNEWCIATGHPGGFDPSRTPPIRLGRLLQRGSFLVTDCAVISGDSGGPLFDVAGKLIGIHSNIGASLSENRHVPIEVYSKQWDDLKEGERNGSRFANSGGRRDDPGRPVLGVQLGDPAKTGVEVVSVQDGSPAQEAGIEPGDVIVEIGGKKVRSASELVAQVSKHKPGDEIEITRMRDGEEIMVEVKLTSLAQLMRGRNPGENSRAGTGGRPGSERKRGAGRKPGETDRSGGDEELEEDGNPGLEKLLEGALKGEPLRLTPEQLEELGGSGELRERLQGMLKKRGMDQPVPAPRTRGGGDNGFFAAAMEALRPVVAEAGRATVSVLLDGDAVALGTVVSEGGLIITKDTETREGEVEVLVPGGGRVGAELVERFPQRDLALFKIDAEELTPVRWAEGEVPMPAKGLDPVRWDEPLPLGTMLTAVDADNKPLGIGLVSVETRTMAGAGFLGVQTTESKVGIQLASVVAGSPARRSGLRKGDRILTLDGSKVGAPHEFGQEIRSRKVGDSITLGVSRGGDELEFEVELAARSQRAQGGGRRGRLMGGETSERKGGFPTALQHDIPITPAQCGGPLLDLDGRCVGINVSRAGRIKTLAIPAGEIREILASLPGETDS